MFLRHGPSSIFGSEFGSEFVYFSELVCFFRVGLFFPSLQVASFESESALQSVQENSFFYSIENYRGWSSLMTTRIRHIRCIRLF